STAAAAALYRLDPQQVRWALSYAGQQASGLGTILRDRAHVEKAFAWGGMAARNGLAAAELVAHGFSGVDDVFADSPSFFDLFPGTPTPEELTAELGSRFEIGLTN